MPKKKEIQNLILKYRADIADLEEREEDLIRRIEILENLIPPVLVWYMWKVSQASREVPFPQHETETEARERLEHLEGVLRELQVADELLKEEEKIMRKRIEHMEKSLADVPEEYPEKMKDILIKPILASEPKKEDEDRKRSEEQMMKLDDLLQPEDTDWKTVAQDLQKKVTELNDKLKNSSQQLQKSEDHVKQLKEEYSKLEKELQDKIKLLEKKTLKRPSISEVADEDKEKYLQKDMESKEALSVMQEALEEVRSVKETLSRTQTSRKDDHVEPLVEGTEIQDTTFAPIETPETKEELEPEDSLPKPTVLSPEEVIKPEIGEELSKVSISKPQIFEPEVVLMTIPTEPSEHGQEKVLDVVPEGAQEEKDLEVIPGELPSELPTSSESESETLKADLKEALPETALPENARPDSGEVEVEIGSEPEPETVVPKESVSEMPKAEASEMETAVSPDTPQIPVESEATAEASMAPDATTTKEFLKGPASELPKAETPELEPEIFSDTDQIPAESEDTAKVSIAPDEAITKDVLQEPASELPKAATPVLEPSITPDTPQIPAESEYTAKVSIAPDEAITKDVLQEPASELPKAAMPEFEISITPDTPQILAESEASTEPRKTTALKEDISEPFETEKVPPQIPAELISKVELMASPETADLKETPKAEKPGSEAPEITELAEPPPELVATAEVPIASSEPKYFNELISQPDGPATHLPEVPLSSENLAKPVSTTEDPIASETPVTSDLPSIPGTSVPTKALDVPETITEVVSEADESKTHPEIPTEQAVTVEATVVSPKLEDVSKNIDVGKPKAQASTETPMKEALPEAEILAPDTLESEIPQIFAEPASVEFPNAPPKGTIPKELVPVEAQAKTQGLETKDDQDVPKFSVESTEVENIVVAPITDVSKEPSLKEERSITRGEEILVTSKPSKTPEVSTGSAKSLSVVSEQTAIVTEIEAPQEPSKVKHIESEPHKEPSIFKQETPAITDQMTTETKPPSEPVSSKTAADRTEAQVMISEPQEITPEISTKGPPSSIGLKQEERLPAGTPSVPSLAAQTLQSKMRVKDHLIKSVADELRELARNNVWAGNQSLEAAANTKPVNTYDFDRTLLHTYLKGKEPENYTASMKGGSSSNPLNVRIVRKVDNDSLLIEWGPPPSADVVGFQIYLNGLFKYWVHSSKRNLALLHPLDLKLLLEIAVSPIDLNGQIISRSIVMYEPK